MKKFEPLQLEQTLKEIEDASKKTFLRNFVLKFKKKWKRFVSPQKK